MSYVVATAFLFLCGFSNVSTAQESIAPSDIWYRAFLLAETANDMEAQGKFLEAINKLDEAMPLYAHLAQHSPEFHPEIVRTRRNLNAEKRDQLKIALKTRAQVDLQKYRVWFVCSVLGILSVILVATLLFKRKQEGEHGEGGKASPATS